MILALLVWIVLGITELLSVFWFNAGLKKVMKQVGSFEDQVTNIRALMDEYNSWKESRPADSGVLQKKINLLLVECLFLATGITDNPRHGITANYMEYFPDQKRLYITQAVGSYWSWRLNRYFDPSDVQRSGSCGEAFRERQILIIPDTSKSNELYFTYDMERNLLLGVINIPIFFNNMPVGVLNIDSPRRNLFKGHVIKERVNEIKDLVEQVISMQYATAEPV